MLIAWKRGTFADPDGGAGTTRLLFDMLVRGTRDHDRVTFNSLLEEMGTQVHPFVTQDAAFLRATCLTRNFEATVGLLAEALARPALDPTELERLRAEAIDGLISDRDDDDTVADLFLRRALYAGHPLARSPQGEVVDVRAANVELLRAAHAQLTRDQMVVAFAGDLSMDGAVRATEALAAGLSATAAGARLPEAVREPAGLTVVVVDKPERTQAQLRLGRPALTGADEDATGFWLGVTAFGGTFTSPFCREVRDVRGWSYTAYAAWDRRARLGGPLVLRSAPSVADVVDCLALELDMYRALARGELAAADVEFARSYLLNRDPLERASAAQLLPAMVKNELLGQPPGELFRSPERLQALTVGDVGAAVRRHLDPDRAVATLVATADDVIEPLRARLEDATVRVVDYRDGVERTP
jgi:zinc protease